MKRTPFRRRVRADGPTAPRESKPWAQTLLAATLKPLRRGTYAGTTQPEAKTQAWRCPVLLEMARNRPCLLLVPGICNHRVDTTVAAHSNQSIHGKAGARKADDCYVVEACSACHYWLDFGKAPAEHKAEAFTLAHARQVLSWRLRVLDPGEPLRFQRAAQKAIEHLQEVEG